MDPWHEMAGIVFIGDVKCVRIVDLCHVIRFFLKCNSVFFRNRYAITLSTPDRINSTLYLFLKKTLLHYLLLTEQIVHYIYS
jgi:hypothetical protein